MNPVLQRELDAVEAVVCQMVKDRGRADFFPVEDIYKTYAQSGAVPLSRGRVTRRLTQLGYTRHTEKGVKCRWLH